MELNESKEHGCDNDLAPPVCSSCDYAGRVL